MQIFFICLIFFIFLIYLVQIKYMNFKIFGISFSIEDSNLPQVKKAIKNEKIRQFVIVATVSFLFFFMKNKKYIDLIFFSLIFIYFILFYLSFYKFRNELMDIKIKNNISYKRENRKIDKELTKVIGENAPSIKYIWMIWALSFIPIFINIFLRNFSLLIIDIYISIVLVGLPLGYEPFVKQNNIGIPENLDEFIKYRKKIDYNNGLMYLIISLESIFFIILLNLISIMNNQSLDLILVSVLVFIFSIGFVFYIFNKKNKDAEDNIKGNIYINEKDVQMKWGMYYDPKDKRIIVPKISGLGTTINVGNPIGRIIGIGVIIILIVSLVFAFISMLTDINVTLTDEYIEIKAPFYNDEIKYSDIEKVEILDNDLSGKRVNGYGVESKEYGYFILDNYGEVFLYRNNFIKEHIDIYEEDGSVTIFNLDTVKGTEDFYELILKILNTKENE